MTREAMAPATLSALLKVVRASTDDERDELLRDFLTTCYPTKQGQDS